MTWLDQQQSSLDRLTQDRLDRGSTTRPNKDKPNVRVVGALALLFGLTTSRVLQLTVNDVLVTSGTVRLATTIPDFHLLTATSGATRPCGILAVQLL